MSRDISPVVTAPATATTSPPTTLRRRWMRFTRHFLLMLAAMYLGMLTLYPAYDFLAGRAGYADATNELPIPSALGMAVAMTLPMAALMFHHRHGWRPVMEMAAAMTLPTLSATLLHLTGTITADAVISVGHTAMIPAMLAAMLLRFDHYAGPKAAQSVSNVGCLGRSATGPQEFWSKRQRSETPPTWTLIALVMPSSRGIPSQESATPVRAGPRAWAG